MNLSIWHGIKDLRERASIRMNINIQDNVGDRIAKEKKRKSEEVSTPSVKSRPLRSTRIIALIYSRSATEILDPPG